DQSLRRPHSFGDVRHVQTVPIDHVRVLTAFFLHTKSMNPFEGIKRESLQLPAVGTGTGEFDIQTPVSRRLREETRCAVVEISSSSSTDAQCYCRPGGFGSPCRINLFERRERQASRV